MEGGGGRPPSELTEKAPTLLLLLPCGGGMTTPVPSKGASSLPGVPRVARPPATQRPGGSPHLWRPPAALGGLSAAGAFRGATLISQPARPAAYGWGSVI